MAREILGHNRTTEMWALQVELVTLPNAKLRAIS